MSDLLKKFTADVDLATTKRRIINIGRALAAHFDEETATLRARAETAEAKLRGQPYELIIETYKSQLAEAEQRAEKAERERDAAQAQVAVCLAALKDAEQGVDVIYSCAEDADQAMQCEGVQYAINKALSTLSHRAEQLMKMVENARELCEVFALGPLDAAAKYGPDYDTRKAEQRVLLALADALSQLNGAPRDETQA